MAQVESALLIVAVQPSKHRVEDSREIFVISRVTFGALCVGAFAVVHLSNLEVRAAYVDEVIADDPAFWWRLDEPAGEDFGENSGALDSAEAEFIDVELGVPGLISTDGGTAARFDGEASQVVLTNEQDFNLGGPWVEKSVVLWFQADDPNADEEQIIFDEGGTTRGINVYVHEGQVFAGIWNRAAGDGGGVASPWPTDNAGMEITVVGAPIEAGETYQVALVYEGDSGGFDGTVSGYLNGELIGQEDGVGELFAHSNVGGLGFRNSETAFPGANVNTACCDATGNYFAGVIDEVALYNEVLSAERIKAQFTAAGGAAAATRLLAGDANQDLEFNQLDLVQVQIAAKYLTGNAATWGEGDWDGAPGGEPGSPPAGNGFFDQLDIISALGAGTYLTGPYAALASDPGTEGDGQTSIIYDPSSGQVSVDAPSGVELTSINIDSASGIFTGDAATNLGGSFDNDADSNIFKATFGSSFGSVSFGNVAQTGLSREFVVSDLTAVGSLSGGGDLGDVDLIYVPEPSAMVLLSLAALMGLWSRRS